MFYIFSLKNNQTHLHNAYLKHDFFVCVKNPLFLKKKCLNF